MYAIGTKELIFLMVGLLVGLMILFRGLHYLFGNPRRAHHPQPVRASSGESPLSTDEAHLLEDLHRRAERMEARMENLETILIERGRPERAKTKM